MSNQIKTVSNLSKGDYIYKKSVNKRAACYAHPCFVSKILLFLGRIIENTCRLILKFISLNFLNVSLPFKFQHTHFALKQREHDKEIRLHRTILLIVHSMSCS